MPTMASTMPRSRLSPRQVSRKRPRLCLISFSARFTSRPACRKGARRATFEQIGPFVDHDREVGWQMRNLDSTIEQPFAELHVLLRQAAALDNPDHSGPAVIGLDELERDE